MTLRTALRTSSNRAAVRLLRGRGHREDRDLRQGAWGWLCAERSLAGAGVRRSDADVDDRRLRRIREQGHAAAVHPRFAGSRISRARCCSTSKEAPKRVVSETTAFLLTSMLADVVNQGTAYKARQVGFTLPAGGKTGTTNDYVDAWFVGFTPSLATGVWVGFDQPQTILANGYAGDLAVPLWARFMRDATKGDKPDWFSPPKNIVGVNVCRMSGKLPNKGCDAVEVLTDSGEVQMRSMVYTDYFVRGRQPTEVCPLHEGHGFFDRVAGVFGKDGERPVPADAAGLPPSDTQTSPTTGVVTGGTLPDGQKAAAQEEPKKKRGFWSRVFGGGGKDKGKEKPKEEDKEKDQHR